MTLERGTLLHKRYRIVEILGQGGMGSVYRAVDENLGVDIALKENLFTTDEYSRQFRLEAVILANLRHPNMPRVSDHFVVGEQGQYLVMDYIEGEDLRQRMERVGMITEDEAVLIGAAMCDALAYLHTRKPPILHRDLKPGNVKITPDGHIFLVDFGLAKVVQGSQATTTGARAMTPGYSPPEQYGTARTDPRTDVYSLGATLYASLCGIIPEDGLARAMDNAQLTPLRKRNPKVSKRLAAVIEKAMSIDPAERYQSAEEFQKALLSSKSKTQQLTGNYLVEPPPPVEENAPSPDKPKSNPPAGGPPYPAEDNGEDKPFKPPKKRRKSGCMPRFLILVLLILAAFLTWNFAPGVKEQVGTFLSSLSAAATATQQQPTATMPLPSTESTSAEATSTEPSSTESAAPTVTSTFTATPAPTFTLTPAATATFTLTPSPTITFTPSPTPRGGGFGQFAFASTRSGVSQIYIANGDGSNPLPLTDMPDGACQPTWSPDGAKLIFTSPCSGPDDGFANSSLYVINAEGTNQAPLLDEPGGDYDPAWSPDGKKVAFTSNRLGRPSIFVFDVAANTTTLLFESTGNFLEARSPAWSHANNLIAFVADRGISEIWAMPDTGTSQDAVQLVYNGGDHVDFDPVWSPDGQYVRFSQRKNGLFTVLLMQLVYEDRETLNATRPILSPSWIENIEYSPDGSWLLFESVDEKNNRDIYLMTADGETVTRLTDNPGADFDPVWRPAQVP
jgi:serine/threonine protein kinase